MFSLSPLSHQEFNQLRTIDSDDFIIKYKLILAVFGEVDYALQDMDQNLQM